MVETCIKKRAEVYSLFIMGLNFCETIVDWFEMNKMPGNCY